MRRISSLAFAVAMVVASSLAAVAQGWGPGNGPGRGIGPCAQGQNSTECWRTKNPEKHAACWSKANGSGLRGPARRSFMTECMTK
jgi:hypothetical protein